MAYWWEVVAKAEEGFRREVDDFDDIDELVGEIARRETAFFEREQDVVSFLSSNPEALGWIAPKGDYYGAGEYLRAAVENRLKGDLRDAALDAEVERAGDVVATIQAAVGILAEIHGRTPGILYGFDKADFEWYGALEAGEASAATVEGVFDVQDWLKEIEAAGDAVLRREAGIGMIEFVNTYAAPIDRVAAVANRSPERFVQEVLSALPSSAYAAGA